MINGKFSIKKFKIFIDFSKILKTSPASEGLRLHDPLGGDPLTSPPLVDLASPHRKKFSARANAD